MFNNLYDIETIQLDHTSRCNLKCPQCARYYQGGSVTNSNMPVTDLSLDDYKILLEPFDLSAIKLFYCGNFGDVIASPTFDETFDYCINKNVKQIKISTNGASRTTDWWSELAQKSNGKLQVIFAIDGLEDTNHIYRVGANWNRLIKNVTAFIEAGGYARWDFIEFEHNYHQIHEAQRIAVDLGFKVFNIKYTGRFAEQQTTEISTPQGIVTDRSSNYNQTDMTQIKNKFNNFADYVNNTTIACKYIKEKTIFVDMCMKLWPCTWLGAPAYLNKDNPQYKSIQHLYNLYGTGFNDMRIHGWDILDHEFFKTYLEKSWNTPNETYKRIYTCGRTCGNQFEFSSGYGQNTNKKKLT